VKDIKHFESCPLCKSTNITRRDVTIRGNSQVKLMDCLDCTLAFLSSFEHISPSHYENSGMWDESAINIEDWINDTKHDDLRRVSLLEKLAKDKAILDIGTGNGNFVAEISKIAREAVGIEPEKRLNESFKMRNLKIMGSLEEVEDKFDLVTMFHVLEHIPEPIKFLTSVKNNIKIDGLLVIEVPNLDDALLKIYESSSFSNFTFWDNHLYTYNARTLEAIIKAAGFRHVEILGVQRYSLANHLYWLVKGKPGGHKIWSFMNSDEIQKSYEELLSKFGGTDTLIAFARDFVDIEK
jgi:2-polyprenyl-3-methyl-5-hydroxy-6-metoxy-1,4-benzoquinol methylase